MAIKRITDLSAASALVGTELVEVSQLSATVTISAATLSAQASDNSYNDSGAGFVAAGFAVGNRVRVSGFTGNVANNILVGVITALTAGKMTIGGTDGDVIVDDAAGETVTISKWTSARIDVQAIADLKNLFGATITTAGTAYNLDNADRGKYNRFTNASAKTITVRTNATHALTADAEWHFRNVGAADLTVSPAGGVTISSPAGGSLVIPAGGTATLKRVATDTFDLFGVTNP